MYVRVKITARDQQSNELHIDRIIRERSAVQRAQKKLRELEASHDFVTVQFEPFGEDFSSWWCAVRSTLQHHLTYND